jgi:hypothetical protein
MIKENTAKENIEIKDVDDKMRIFSKVKGAKISDYEKSKIVNDLRSLEKNIKIEAQKISAKNQHPNITDEDLKAAIKKYIPSWEPELPTDEINVSITEGQEYLIKGQINGGWGSWGLYGDALIDECPKDKFPTRIWDTATTVSALLETGVSENSKVIQDSIKWLKRQIRNSDGGFPDLPIKCWDCLPQDYIFLSNVYETSSAMIAVLEAGEKVSSTYIQESIDFLLKVHNKTYGAWSSVPDGDMDVGATSNAIIALVKAKIDLKNECIQSAIQWINDNQHNNGGWGLKWKGDSSEIKLTRTHDAICALLAVGLGKEEKTIQKGIKYLLTIQDLLEDENGEWGLVWSSELVDDSEYTTSAITATAISALLKVGFKKDNAAVKSGIRYLIKTKDIEKSWGMHTPRVITCLHEYMMNT